MQGRPIRPWAKLQQEADDRVVAWHPLADHCADVAAVFEALLECTLLRRRLARLIDQEDLTPVQVARLGVLAFLHDRGTAGFSAVPGARHASGRRVRGQRRLGRVVGRGCS